MYDLRNKLDSIAIYGAGSLGHKLLDILRQANVIPSCFVQTNPSGKSALDGIPIISVAELVAVQEEYLILIAITDKKERKNVRSILKDNKYNMSLVYDMSSFIIDNGKSFYNGSLGSKECLVCGSKIEEFAAAGENNPIFFEKKVIGGGYRENVVCPCCGSNDRTRWVYWVLKKYTNMLEEECTIIHFAPEKQIQEKLKDNEKCDYYAGDICHIGDLHKIDVTEIPYTDNMADYIIINHVLEHVSDEKKAVRELKRVLKDNGKIIMSFPVSMAQKTFEDPNIVSEADRDKYYGQKDHVRLYGTDYKERFENYGLKIKVFSPKDYLTNDDIEKYGLIKDDILMICTQGN